MHMPHFSHRALPRLTQITHILRKPESSPSMCHQWRLRGDPACRLSQNFQTTHQLDVDEWTELLRRIRCEDWPMRRVRRERADTIRQPPSAQNHVSDLPFQSRGLSTMAGSTHHLIREEEERRGNS
jgi:hypothetical protein